VDTLKVDRSFVKDITTDSDDAEICAAIIAMAHTLGLKVVAEGVEDEQQLSFLRQQACDFVQGYFYSPPVPVTDFVALLEAKNGVS
jgi:EAL domain-containing protein (putative c-di-GMP-specific phosphodiesterase class I)